jgi:glycosyl transferase family 87
MGIGLVVGSASTHHSFGIPRQGRAAPEWVVGPLAPYGGSMTAARFILLLSAMWVCYLLLLVFADAVRVRWAVAAVVTLMIVFTVGPPLFSRDVFSYIDYARLGALHDVNPYVHGPAAARHDRLFAFVAWRHTPSVYGPIFTLSTFPLAALGLPAALWTLKALTGVASLGCVALVWRCARRTGASPVFAALFFGVNPLLLVYAVGGAHNDVFAVLLLTAAVTLAAGNRGALAGASLVTAVAVKATAGIALPFLALGSRRRGPVLAGMAVAGTLLGLAAFAGFGTAALEPFKLVAQHRNFYSHLSVPPHVAVLFGADPRSAAVRVAAELIAAVAVVALVVRTAIRRDWMSDAGWAVFVVLVTTTWLLAWYTIWLLPFAGVARNRRLAYAALSLGTFVISSRLYYLNH